MYMYICVYIYLYIYVRIGTYFCVYVYVYLCVYMYIYIFIYICKFAPRTRAPSINIGARVSGAHVHVYIHICIYIYLYTYTNTHTYTYTHTQVQEFPELLEHIKLKLECQVTNVLWVNSPTVHESRFVRLAIQKTLNTTCSHSEHILFTHTEQRKWIREAVYHFYINTCTHTSSETSRIKSPTVHESTRQRFMRGGSWLSIVL